jgi:hypothetical protein
VAIHDRLYRNDDGELIDNAKAKLSTPGALASPGGRGIGLPYFVGIMTLRMAARVYHFSKPFSQCLTSFTWYHLTGAMTPRLQMTAFSVGSVGSARSRAHGTQALQT